jgi:hypothetical protein
MESEWPSLVKGQIVSFTTEDYNGRLKAVEVIVEQDVPQTTPWWKKNEQESSGQPTAAQR